MIRAPRTSPAQYTVKATGTPAASTLFHIQNPGGTDLVTFKPIRSTYHHLFSAPSLTTGATYSLYMDGTSVSGPYAGGTYSGGTLKKPFIVAGKVTAVTFCPPCLDPAGTGAPGQAGVPASRVSATRYSTGAYGKSPLVAPPWGRQALFIVFVCAAGQSDGRRLHDAAPQRRGLTPVVGLPTLAGNPRCVVSPEESASGDR
jgi:hypothetical protein